MIYLFEDNEKDVLSKLYMQAYPDEIRKNFVYTKGNGDLIKFADIYLKSSDVAVFIDMVPDNENCRDIYLDLVKLSVDPKYSNRLLIFPIVCSEYYMIKSLCKYTEYIDKDHNDVKICLDCGDYRQSTVYTYGGRVCKNFEKYCKIILKRHVIDCIKHKSRFDDGSVNEKYSLYYCEDCLCDKSDSLYNIRSLKDKAIELLSVYDVVPSGSLTTHIQCIDSSIASIHRKLVDDYNKMLANYIKLGIIRYTKKKAKNIVYAM